MLTAAQHDELATRGLTYVRGAISRDQAAAIEDRMWAFLRSAASIATTARRGHRVDCNRHCRACARQTYSRRLPTNALTSIVDQLLGAGAWTQPGNGGQALVSFPQPGPWEIPHKVWHFDLPARGPIDRLCAVRVFGYAATVEPRGGATLLVEGSHELVRRMIAASATGNAGQSADVRRRLVRRAEWFKALCSAGGERIQHLMIDGDEVDGVPVRVIEATGAAGDVCVMHPWMLHNIAMNCADQPRLMMTQTYLRDDNPYYN